MVADTDDLKLEQFEQDFVQRSSVAGPIPIEQRLGAVIRTLRLEHRLTLSDLATAAGISTAMLSRLETGGTSASLDVMQRLAQALGVPLSFVFKSIEEPHEEAQLIRVAEQVEVVRTGTRHGHTYRMLSYNRGPNKRFEPFLITMDNEKQAYPRFQHPGTEFIYMLQGSMQYRCGAKVYDLSPGDALTFSGSEIHGPETVVDEKIQFITVIVYDPE